MRVAYRRASLVAAASALMGLAACSGNKSQPMDAGLKQDLAATGASGLGLAPSATPNLVIAADENGPTSAPAPAARKIVPKPTPKPAPQLASNRTAPAPTPAPQPVIEAPAPTAPAPVPVVEPAPLPREPAPLPPLARPAQERQKGVYKTEGQIFQQMPWIKP